MKRRFSPEPPLFRLVLYRTGTNFSRSKLRRLTIPGKPTLQHTGGPAGNGVRRKRADDAYYQLPDAPPPPNEPPPPPELELELLEYELDESELEESPPE